MEKTFREKSIEYENLREAEYQRARKERACRFCGENIEIEDEHFDDDGLCKECHEEVSNEQA